MTNKRYLTPTDIASAAKDVADRINALIVGSKIPTMPILYGIPRGGVPAAFAVKAALAGRCVISDDPQYAHLFIDDIIDTGHTAKKYADEYGTQTFALFERGENVQEGEWLVFPWEAADESPDNDASATDNVVRLLQYIGEDPMRGGLKETPKRVVKAWDEWCSGYGKNPAEILKVFEDGAEGSDEMVTVRSIPFYSHCEHHMAPFFGTVTVAYIPDGKIVGLSKIPRLVDVFAKRLQVQERLTNQIADAMQEHLKPKGVGVTVTARHLCMESRGIARQGSETVTTAVRGAMKTDVSARAEFLEASRG